MNTYPNLLLRMNIKYNRITNSQQMSVYCIRKEQLLNMSLEEAWSFFSSPANLQKITPPDMGFEILSGADSDMYAGQIITYRVRPMFGIPMFWMTEITHVSPHKFFVDEQRVGPYRIWHHEHHFEKTENGVKMTDIVHYQLPLGLLGRFAHWLFVKKRVAEIFTYREKVILSVPK